MATNAAPQYGEEIATAAAFSVAMTEVAMGTSISMLMENAVTNESHSQSIQNAGVSQCCALMLAAGTAGATKGI
ncbi:RebB family R body protein [Marinomonas mediterranea]|jgi:Killing trait.|uniref:Killing trait, RebB n=1 Tax=Marinomonas mediterranea (strain ATCC 700492 / JCM 21426 / NBRC 103028 / MMB-1) TaxID=717774 RepID=F2JYC1_MARM1|nr:RebB family R body protein [Marinomonas mediterranea]ADZ91952.1 hypothetical protein Marme_2722 [Marinomonas mediterranea MMB-1]WCN09905.1 hypothetical protein GV055_13750 [Marinomonas mediterranea]WCN13985.1 hypothetical protein GV054_13740 [Marinomonas mediterranea]WCN18035.1 hypothetical protein GV053_13765 [Marinomonas mediterranea MMB-1]